jgi:hypothetical protein
MGEKNRVVVVVVVAVGVKPSKRAERPRATACAIPRLCSEIFVTGCDAEELYDEDECRIWGDDTAETAFAWGMRMRISMRHV